ncbi:MAG: 1,4-dihydroxy-2-naphthoate octaprenyltransferase [Bacteroidaceae bacterium]|nr:1,4-dihydroxy-2-naphthoate octaprenyltransferase [Bacteroidaceae bacterium]
METHINSTKAWALATRPKTLTGAAAPVLVGAAMAWHETGNANFPVLPALLCLLFAFIMQIDANFINDYFDFQKGTDREDRLGPERACAQGWITPQAMRWGIGVTTLLGCGVGCLIMFCQQQWELILIGLCCVVFCFLYTTHLSYLGLGDVLVLVFFGIVPVGFTCYVVTGGMWSSDLTLAGLAMGLATDNLLMVNNYRDRKQDKLSGKRTIVVHIIYIYGEETGAKVARWIYLGLGITAASIAWIVINRVGSSLAGLMLIYMALHLYTYRKICMVDGKALNKELGATARNIFLFGLLFAIAIAY